MLFYANGSKEKNGIVPIMGRVTINGTVAQFSCKRSIPKFLLDTLLATELANSPVDCTPSHAGDTSVLFLAAVHIEDGLECTPHNPYFLFGAKLNYVS